MKISVLLESTSDDLFRKIDALDAMIKDQSTTAGEKENAAALKKKIEDKLAKMFPGAKRPAPKPAGSQPSYSSGFGGNDFWAGMAKAAQAAQDLEDLKKNDPEAYKRKMEIKLNDMKTKLAAMKRRHIPGDLQSADDIRNLTNRLESFMSKEFPEMYKEILNKRREANYKAYARRDKKKAEKEKAEKATLKKSGLAKASELGKEYAEPLQALHKALEGVKLSGGYNIKVGEKNHWNWKTGHGKRFIMYMPQIPTGKIREAWNSLDSDTQQQLRDALSRINTQGWKHEGMTEVQKNKILAAMTPYVKPK